MGVSQGEFAALCGVTKQAVSKWAKRGLLVRDPDGSVNVEKSRAKVDARPENYRGGSTKGAVNRQPAVDAPSDDLPTQAKALIDAGQVEMLPHAEAVAKKENYLALLRQLEYDKESGAVVAIEDVQKQIAEQLSRVRTRIIATPAKVAGRVVLLKSAEEVQAFLDEEFALVLSELTLDARSARSGTV